MTAPEGTRRTGTADLRRWAGQSGLLRSGRAGAIQLRARLAAPGNLSRIFVNSIPKAGTHLLMSALDAMPEVRMSGLHIAKPDVVRDKSGFIERSSNVDWDLVNRLLSQKAKPGQYVTAHLWAFPELRRLLHEKHYATLFVVRDPRDVVISQAAYLTRLRRHPHHDRFVGELDSAQARYRAIIEGFPPTDRQIGAIPFVERLRGHAPWLDDPGVLTCRFEDLIGPSGGGSEQAQLDTLEQVAAHIEIDLDRDELRALATQVWSPDAPTFRAGKIGQWQERFDEETVRIFNLNVDPELLARYGYAP